jgi:hypothetical protein
VDDDPLADMDSEARARYELYLQSKTDNFIRMDVTAAMMRKWTEWQRADFIRALPDNKTIKTIHLSGNGLVPLLSSEQLDELIINGIGNLEHLQELFIFRGNVIQEETVAKCLQRATGVKLLMMWQFVDYNPTLSAAVRMHPNLERVTINLPMLDPNITGTKYRYKWGCLDLFVMAVAGMPKLRVLQIRCDEKHQQTESIISPDAMTVLINSTSITSLYLENVGLTDEHVDNLSDELTLIHNDTLTSLDLKDNLFSDDVLYTFGNTFLPKNDTLQFLDLSGTHITEAGGTALAHGIVNINYTLLHIDLEGVRTNYMNEFDIPDGFKYSPWMQRIRYQLRINRAYFHGMIGEISQQTSINNTGQGRQQQQQRRKKITKDSIPTITRDELIEALIHVADHIGCLDYFVRTHSKILFPAC